MFRRRIVICGYRNGSRENKEERWSRIREWRNAECGGKRKGCELKERDDVDGEKCILEARREKDNMKKGEKVREENETKWKSERRGEEVEVEVIACVLHARHLNIVTWLLRVSPGDGVKSVSVTLTRSKVPSAYVVSSPSCSAYSLTQNKYLCHFIFSWHIYPFSLLSLPNDALFFLRVPTGETSTYLKKSMPGVRAPAGRIFLAEFTFLEYVVSVSESS